MPGSVNTNPRTRPVVYRGGNNDMSLIGEIKRRYVLRTGIQHRFADGAQTPSANCNVGNHSDLKFKKRPEIRFAVRFFVWAQNQLHKKPFVGCVTRYAPIDHRINSTDEVGNGPGRPLDRCPAAPCKLPTLRGRG